MYKLFIKNIDGELELNIPELALVKEFRDVIARSNRIKGDADGRKKRFAFEEFAYVWFYADYKSPYIELSEKNRHEKSLQETKLLEYWAEWKPDRLVKDAIIKYQSLQADAIVRLLIQLKRGTANADRLVSLCNNRVDELLDDAESNKDNKKLEETITLVNAQLTNVFEITNKIKGTLATLEDYEHRARVNEENKVLAIGGNEIGERADQETFKFKGQERG